MKRYHWINLEIIRRCVLVNEWNGCRVSTIEELPDGWWRVITHNKREGHEYKTKQMAQRAIQKLYDIDESEVEEW